MMPNARMGWIVIFVIFEKILVHTYFKFNSYLKVNTHLLTLRHLINGTAEKCLKYDNDKNYNLDFRLKLSLQNPQKGLSGVIIFAIGFLMDNLCVQFRKFLHTSQ